MQSLLNQKVRGIYNGATITEGVLTIIDNVWCFCSNCESMNDEWRKEWKDRRGYKYIWLFGNKSNANNEEFVVNHFTKLELIKKMNHEL